jgi:hypothetical protein
MFAVNRLVLLSHARPGPEGRPVVLAYRTRVLYRGAAAVWLVHPQLRPESGKIAPLERVALEVGVARGVVTFPAVVRQVGSQQGVQCLGLTLDGAPVPAQRRKHTRARVQLPAMVTLAGVALPSITQDLSTGGCSVVLVDTALVLPVGVKVEVTLPGAGLSLQAVLLRRERGMHALAFTPQDDHARGALERVVARCETESRRLQVLAPARASAPALPSPTIPTIPVEAMP